MLVSAGIVIARILNSLEISPSDVRRSPSSPGAAPDAPRVRDTCLACLALSAPYDRARVTDDPWEYSGLPSRRSVSGIEYLYSPTNRLGEIDVIQHRPGARSPVVTPVPTTNGTVRRESVCE